MSKSYADISRDAWKAASVELTKVWTDLKDSTRRESAELRSLGLTDTQLRLAIEVQLLHKTLKRAVRDFNRSSKSVKIPDFKVMRFKPSETIKEQPESHEKSSRRHRRMV